MWFEFEGGSKIQNTNNREHTATTIDIKTKVIYLKLSYKNVDISIKIWSSSGWQIKKYKKLIN